MRMLQTTPGIIATSIVAALGYEKTETPRKYAYRVEEARAANGAQKVPTITMEEILRRADNNFIDLLKIDIEGAERQVFSGGAEWLQRVGLIIIELHDRFKPGCAKAFYDAIAHFDFVQSQKGENLFVWLSGRAPGATGQTVSAAYP